MWVNDPPCAGSTSAKEGLVEGKEGLEGGLTRQVGLTSAGTWLRRQLRRRGRPGGFCVGGGFEPRLGLNLLQAPAPVSSHLGRGREGLGSVSGNLEKSWKCELEKGSRGGGSPPWRS